MIICNRVCCGGQSSLNNFLIVSLLQAAAVLLVQQSRYDALMLRLAQQHARLMGQTGVAKVVRLARAVVNLHPVLERR